MPVWFVLGVQSRARFIVVNCCGVDLLNVVHCDVGVPMGCWVVCGLELTACCCHRKAPMTTIIRSTGIPILSQRRVRDFIWFLQWIFFDSLPAVASHFCMESGDTPDPVKGLRPLQSYYHCVFDP